MIAPVESYVPKNLPKLLNAARITKTFTKTLNGDLIQWLVTTNSKYGRDDMAYFRTIGAAKAAVTRHFVECDEPKIIWVREDSTTQIEGDVK